LTAAGSAATPVGGAGARRARGDVRAADLPRHVDGCKRAAAEAGRVLAEGGAALDAAQRAVLLLEDDPSFNAGTGASLTADGTIELDASIMEGTELRGGGVCALPPFKNPIAIARAVLDDGVHVLYAGEGPRGSRWSAASCPRPWRR
jgi:beta-aspartyl-peptidase (threonine type)